MHHVLLCLKILLVITLLCDASAVFAAPLVVYDLEGIRQGVTKDEAIENFEKQGYKLIQGDVPDRRVLIMNRVGKEHLGSLYFCSDKLFANSFEITGGISVMIRRASQLNAKYGHARMKAESKINDIGEVNTLSFFWSNSIGEISLEFTPQTSRLNESQHITYSVPSICK